MRETPLIFEKDQTRTGRLATVAMLAPLNRTYSYLVPDDFGDRLQPGMRVEVPFGRSDRAAAAFCVDITTGPYTSTLKPILALIDNQPLLDPGMLELGHWIARYYAAPLGRTLDLMVPAAAKRGAGRRRVRYARLAEAIPTEDSTTGQSDAIAPPAPARPLTPRQASALAVLRDAGGELSVDAWREAAGVGAGVVTALVDAGHVRIETRHEAIDPPAPSIDRREPVFELNEDQHRAITQLTDAVNAGVFAVEVLFGVTGSGKTECYVHAIRAAIARGRQAIMLVPEIALTTQTVGRLQSRFDRVAIVHSGLTDAQRARAWAAIAAGKIDVVLGTRSAVFAPCPNLGLVIVDEEPESGYKSLSAPRYHARDVAIKRAHLTGIPVVLGSATPSLETWHNLHTKPHYHLIRMSHRIRGLAMPTVHLVDMRAEHRERKGVHLLSQAMEWHLDQTLKRGEQAVLLLNRRGYASFLHCPRCDTVIVCPHCSVNMVLHTTTELAHCHYCQARVALPGRCPMAGCGGPLVRFGIGTQRVEEELARKFPTARVRRVDSDSMQHMADYATAFQAFEKRECDVLIGTQMIAKGLDFPFVSFVGVVSADTALSIDDFRAEERTFQLVLQVSGRSGRGDVGGHVVVQTFAAEHKAVQLAVAGNYEAFAEHELDNRRRTGLPPHTRMMRILLADSRLTKLARAADEMARHIVEEFTRAGIKARVFDPQPPPIARLRDAYRYDILITFETAAALMAAADLLKAEELLTSPVQSVTVDVDPVALQ